MNVRSENPYWLFNSPLIKSYDKISGDLDTEILVIGGGISGALAAYKLTKAGCKVTLVSNQHIGTGSTCASTSLLQYEIDTPMVKLCSLIGEKNAIEAYQACYESIDSLEQIHRELKCSPLFQRKKSLLLASTKKDLSDLEREYAMRKSVGFKVSWMSDNDVYNEFGFKSAGAIYSSKAAQTDVYQLTQLLVKWCAENGAAVYDKSEIINLESSRTKVQAHTSDGHKIRALYAVMANGYEAVKWVKKAPIRLHSTYAVASTPNAAAKLWKDNCLIWETARPYIYMRTTTDNRIIIGGKDEPFFSAGKRDKLMRVKEKQLLKAFNAKFPQYPFDIDFAWAGTFAETKDGLPYIGMQHHLPRVYFALGYGGNGITFSAIAADLICEMILDKKHPRRKLFGFERLQKE